MLLLPGNRIEPRPPRLEQWVPAGIDRMPLLRANDVGLDALLRDAGGIGESGPVQQQHDPMEGVRLALVRRGREKKKVGSRLGQAFTEAKARDLIRAATQ